MVFDGDLTDAKLITHLFVQEANHYQSHHIALAIGKFDVSCLQSLNFFLTSEQSSTSLQSAPDR